MTIVDLIKLLSRFPFDTPVAYGVSTETQNGRWQPFYLPVNDAPPSPPAFKIVGGTAVDKGER